MSSIPNIKYKSVHTIHTTLRSSFSSPTMGIYCQTTCKHKHNTLEKGFVGLLESQLHVANDDVPLRLLNSNQLRLAAETAQTRHISIRNFPHIYGQTFGDGTIIIWQYKKRWLIAFKVCLHYLYQQRRTHSTRVCLIG